MTNGKYIMTISRTTVDKLGIKLYDKVSLVVGELVANSYDADAERVTVKIPLGKWLATRSGGEIVDQGFEISVEDDGYGIPPNLINDFYLKVGTDPRADPRRGPLSSPEKKRPRMGRKGIGKLAPFGVCNTIEVRTAGGEKTPKGYKIAHFIMNYNEINQETDAPYYPALGDDDGKYSQKTGTTIKLRNFLHRRTPDAETFHRQLERIFGLQLPDFKIEVVDTESGESFVVGQLGVEIENETKIDLRDRPVILDDETKLQVSGWVAYARHPYKNEEVAGIRIYARGRIVSTTRDFGMKAGFTGEYVIRSYLVGEVHADWLDKDDGEDLVHTGRQDILWDSEIGSKFKEWGQALIKELAKKASTPMRRKAWEVFLEKSNLETEAKKVFGNTNVVDAAMILGKTFGSIASLEELQDAGYVQKLREIVLTVAPHKMLVDKLREIGEKEVGLPLDIIAAIFNDTKVAEMFSLGQIAAERIEALTTLENCLGSKPAADERIFQKLVEGAPWLIDPRWTVLQANQTFENLRSAFERWYFKEYNEKILTSTIEEPSKKPDFVMIHVGRNVEIVEIKRPDHVFDDSDFERLHGYIISLIKFLDENPSFKEDFRGVHATLVCNKIRLGRTPNRAFDKLIDDNLLEKKSWEEILKDAKKVNEDFLRVVRKR